MGVKRWILSLALGLWIFATGLMLLLSGKTALFIEISLQNILRSIINIDISDLTIDIIMVVLGLATIWWSLCRVFKAIYSTGRPTADRSIVDLMYEKRQLSHGLKIAALGGGTGLSTLLRGLKKYTSNITAIVSVSDDGGSSGRLSKELGMLPPGDLRNCMTALADDENLLNELFRYRFRDGQGLEGHSFGNLFLAALTDMYKNDFEEALRKGSQILNIRGRVLPATLTSTTLCAKMRDGRIIKGESEIPKAHGQIVDAFLEPRRCTPPDEVLKAIAEADCIVLGPGSLYTSVIPPLLINGIADAVKKAKAPKIYVCNVMTQPGETDKYTAADHLQALYHHVGPGIVDYIVVNAAPPSKLRKKYQKTGAHPIKADLARLRTMQVHPIAANLVSEETVVRHDPVYLAETIIDTITEHRSKSGEFARLGSTQNSALRIIK
ncbi:MAG: uridine diphosphate-N-acetylglucosamine-binding protein YvcK [Candidatus Bruticola sp.]